MQFLVITGMSGAGKSQAMKVMEDMGYYCMDNLPPIATILGSARTGSKFNSQ